MPITYKYLEDGTPLVVDEINSRIADAVDGLNNLKQDDIALGAFRTEHLPCMIGPPDSPVASTADFTHVSDRDFSEDIVAFGTFYVSTNSAGSNLTLRYDPGLEISSTSNMNALLILFNVQVARFCRDLGGTLPTAPLDYSLSARGRNFEDLVSVTFVVQLLCEDAAGAPFIYTMDKSARTISPGYTYAGNNLVDASDAGRLSSYTMAGQAYKYDAWSCKNAAIRTTLIPADLPEGTKITDIRVLAQTRFCSDDTSSIGILYNKATLTAIPIQALVGASS